ncbi:MAG TPA: hypothetical protein PLZ77_02950 [Lachnospiraceae bacterium]|nr:hypothetical protein [Lachnospiraceae bacterium]HPF29047.1 hypothetical protein [Lachnospiraceae bacterium]
MDGVYEKPVYSKLLKEYIPANSDAIAYAIARSFHWTIASCEDVALKTLEKERIDDSIILSLRDRLPEAEKKSCFNWKEKALSAILIPKVSTAASWMAIATRLKTLLN